MSEDNVPAEFFIKYPESIIKSRLQRIWKQINSQWGTREGIEYLDSLVIVEKGRERQGFDADVISELMVLARLHEKIFPEFTAARLDDTFEFDPGKQ